MPLLFLIYPLIYPQKHCIIKLHIISYHKKAMMNNQSSTTKKIFGVYRNRAYPNTGVSKNWDQAIL